jgi:hypothetical protein
MEPVLLDVAGHRRSPATVPGYHRPVGATETAGTLGFAQAVGASRSASTIVASSGCSAGSASIPRV